RPDPGIARVESRPSDRACGRRGTGRGPPRAGILEPLLRRRLHHRVPAPGDALPALLRGPVPPVARRSGRLCDLPRSLEGAARPPVLLRPDRRLPFPRDAPPQVHAHGRRIQGPRRGGAAGSHLERRRDFREPRRALLRVARVAFLAGLDFLTLAFLPLAFLFVRFGFFAGAFFAGAFFAGVFLAGAFRVAFGGAGSVAGTSL